MPYGPKPRHPYDRFWPKVDKRAPHECWEWTALCEAAGYGIVYAGPLYHTGRKLEKAHRISWEIAHGCPVPPGGHVLHHCDNRPCVNPAHLYLGTNAQNASDRAERKRGKEHRQRGENNDNAKLTEADVRAIIVELQRLPRRSQASIAADFGIKQPQVSRIMRRESWSHLWSE